MRVGTETIRGTECDLEVNARAGTWTVRSPAGDSLGYGDTKEKAVAQASKKLDDLRVRVNVPFITSAGERGVATGIHAGHNGILAKIDGTSVVLSGLRGILPLKPDIPEETLARYLAKQEEAQATRREIGEIESAYQFDLRAAVNGAIAKAHADAA